MSLLTLDSAQQAIIGAMLIDERCVGDVLTECRAEVFVTPRYRALFDAVRTLFGRRAPIDPVTVLAEAGEDLRQTAVECMDNTPTAANVLYYCGVLREQASLYRLRQAGESLRDAQTLEDARAVLAGAEGALNDRPGVTVLSLQEMMAQFLTRMGEKQTDYIRWGLPLLDDTLHTPQGSYVLVGARPSTGKTALALQLGLSIASTKRVGFFSLETGPSVAGDRIAAGTLDTTLPRIQKRRATLSDMQVWAHQIANNPELSRSFFFISGSALTVADIRSMALANRYDVVIIDYVQLVQPRIRGDRTEQMQQVSMDLRAMAQMTGITVIALAQLRRPETTGKAKAPTMADLKESGQFEQDADVVLLMYLLDAENRLSDRILKLDKNKEGYAGVRARLKFNGQRQRFTPVDMEGKPLEPAFEELEEHIQEEIPFEVR